MEPISEELSEELKKEHKDTVLKDIDRDVKHSFDLYNGLLLAFKDTIKLFQEAYENNKRLEVEHSKAVSDFEASKKELESIREELRRCDEIRDDLSREKQDFENAKKSKTKTREELHQMKELLNARIIDYNKVLKEWQGKEKEAYSQHEYAKLELDRIKKDYEKAGQALTDARNKKLGMSEPLFHTQKNALDVIKDIDGMVNELNRRKVDLMKLLSEIVSCATLEEHKSIPQASEKQEKTQEMPPLPGLPSMSLANSASISLTASDQPPQEK